MRTIRSAALGGVIALALLAGACGGGSDSADEKSTTTAAGSPSGTTGDTTGTTPDFGGLVDEDCRFLLAGAFANPLAVTQPGASVDFDEQSAQLKAIAASAPEEIRDAMKTISDGWVKLAEALKGVDLSDPTKLTDPAVAAKLQALDEVFTSDYEQASQKVSEYVAAHCGG